jgi:putative acetyltransferase
MNIRPETPADYDRIASLHARAFEGRIDESIIVSLLRHRGRFDPDLSLVAEIGKGIFGHVLFSPYLIYLVGQRVQAVNLAPIAVEPHEQGKGIGRALIEEGHRIAREKGYTFSFLLGHPEYYSRFGYKSEMFGTSSVEVPASSFPDDMLQTRSVSESDVSRLWSIWHSEEFSVNFALSPDFSLMDWISPNPAVISTVYVVDGEIVGYTRVHKDDLSRPRMFIAQTDRRIVRAMLTHLSRNVGSLTLPLHPLSQSAKFLGKIKPQMQMLKAAMACSLAPGPFDDYYAKLQMGRRLPMPGRVIWPVAFDLA